MSIYNLFKTNNVELKCGKITLGEGATGANSSQLILDNDLFMLCPRLDQNTIDGLIALNGHMCYNNDLQKFQFRENNTWNDIAAIGATGATGAQGPTGATGATGATGTIGPTASLDSLNVNEINEQNLGQSVTVNNGFFFTNATVGYTPSVLSYYEELTQNVTFNGPYTKNVTLILMRCGNMVTLKIPQILDTSTDFGQLVALGAIPDRFIPNGGVMNYVCTGYNNSAASLCSFYIFSNDMYIGSSFDYSPFNNTNTCGILETSVCWTV